MHRLSFEELRKHTLCEQTYVNIIELCAIISHQIRCKQSYGSFLLMPLGGMEETGVT